MSERKVYCEVEMTVMVPVRVRKAMIVRTDADDIEGLLKAWGKGHVPLMDPEAIVEGDPSEETKILDIAGYDQFLADGDYPDADAFEDAIKLGIDSQLSEECEVWSVKVTDSK